MMEQGSPEWHAKRLGKVTASRFADVLTQPRAKAAKERGDVSATARSYMLDLLAEKWTLKPQGPPENAAMRHGTQMEPSAVAMYEAVTGCTCQAVGFVDHATEKGIGCSPDRLIGEDGGLEIKCPMNARIHLEYYLGGVVPKDHIAQVQGGLWITGRKWWDFASYHEDIQDTKLALFVVRVYRDEDYIAELSDRVVAFRDALDAANQQLVEGLNG